MKGMVVKALAGFTLLVSVQSVLAGFLTSSFIESQNISAEAKARLGIMVDQVGGMQKLSTYELVKAYSSNEFAADKKFKDQFVIMSGKLTGLTKDRRSKLPVVHLKASDLPDYYPPHEVRAVLFEVQLALDGADNPIIKNAPDTAADLMIGSDVEVSCRVVGKAGVSVRADQCLVYPAR